MKLSIVIPIYNESANIPLLYKELKHALLPYDHEIIYINDASKDDSLAALRAIAKNDTHVKIINFGYNCGQTAAMSAGIKNATGEVIIPMDGDLQNDPADIPQFLKKLDEGYDVVSGWRKNRKDKAMSRVLPSRIANWVIGIITGIRIHDYGCSMKAYRTKIMRGVNLYGEMHRFIPAYASWYGGKVTEIVVNHRPRMYGKTNYGISRTFKVILDLIVVKFLSRYMNRPIHFFGGLGFISLFFGFIVGLIAIIMRLIHYKYLVETPLPIFSALLIIVGVQLIAMGIVAEMLMRIYYESQKKEPYFVEERINF
jgi:glycosyltransferase involved in cell wall biosynthesis